MKVLFLYSYYKPEKTSGAHIAEDLRVGLVQRGHTMRIFTPVPTRGVSKEVRREYKKTKKHEVDYDGNAEISRFSMCKEAKNPLLRAFRYVLVELRLLICGLTCKKADVIPMGSTPPINGLMGAMIKKFRGIPFVYTVNDLFPDSLDSTGISKKNSLPWKIGMWVSKVTYRNAAHIIAISDSIKDKLVERGVPEDKVTVVHNWIDLDKINHVPRKENTLFDEFHLDRGCFYVTYAGNLGNSQNVSLLVDCAEKLKEHKNIRFVIFGEGTEKEKLEMRIKESGLENIAIYPMQPMERVPEVYSLGDVSFVICKKGVGGGAFPSKAASIMATGTPIIASFDKDSDLCRTIEEGKVGICAEAENIDEAADAILRLYEDRDYLKECSENARTIAFAKFSKDLNLAKRIEIYEKYARKTKE